MSTTQVINLFIDTSVRLNFANSMDILNAKFDAMNVNTELADEFLKKNNEFKPLGSLFDMNDGDFVTTCDKLGNVIHVVKLSDRNEIREVSYSSAYFKKISRQFQGTAHSSEELMEKFRLLAEKIEENIDLMAQLDYLTRNIPIDDAKANILLIVKNLRHWSTEFMNKSIASAYLFLCSKTPLLVLGFITHFLLTFENCIIVSSDETAAVSHLFTKLCHEVGLTNISLVFITNLYDVKEVNTKCVGVITEKSDLDSAVDVLLLSTNTAPWKLQRILVQESVYEEFKQVLSWKTGLRKVISSNQDISDLERKCTDVFAYDQKLFLIDYVDSKVKDTFDQQIIFVEAFRTTKEAMAMLTNYKAFYLSLWSSDISVANEIAFGVEAQVVWINDFANFSGPAKVSQAIYSKLDSVFSSSKIKKTKAITDLCKLLESWLKLSECKRREVISKALYDYIAGSDTTQEAFELVIEVQDALLKPMNNFVEVTSGLMCVGINKPVGIVISDDNYVPLIVSVVNGNGVIFLKKDFSELLEVLKTAGVPVLTLEESQKGDFEVAFDCPYQTKVVWTNFGTVFAN